MVLHYFLGILVQKLYFPLFPISNFRLISYHSNKKKFPRLPSWQPSLIFFNIPIESGSSINPCTLKLFQVTYKFHKAGYWTILHNKEIRVKTNHIHSGLSNGMCQMASNVAISYSIIFYRKCQSADLYVIIQSKYNNMFKERLYQCNKDINIWKRWHIWLVRQVFKFEVHSMFEVLWSSSIHENITHYLQDDRPLIAQRWLQRWVHFVRHRVRTASVSETPTINQINLFDFDDSKAARIDVWHSYASWHHSRAVPHRVSMVITPNAIFETQRTQRCFT